MDQDQYHSNLISKFHNYSPNGEERKGTWRGGNLSGSVRLIK
jgi:hypothetical protein